MRHFIPYQKKKNFQCLHMRSFCCLGFKSILHSEGNENILFYNSRRFIILFLKQKRMWFINEPKTYFKFSLTSLGRWAYQGSSRCAWGLLGGLTCGPPAPTPYRLRVHLDFVIFFHSKRFGKASRTESRIWKLLLFSSSYFISSTVSFRHARISLLIIHHLNTK